MHAVKTYRGSRGWAPLILNLDITWKRVVNLTFRPLCPQEITPLSIEQEDSLDQELVSIVSRKVVYPCRDLKFGPSSPYPIRSTDWATVTSNWFQICVIFAPCRPGNAFGDVLNEYWLLKDGVNIMQEFRLYFPLYFAKISGNFLDPSLNFHRIGNNWKILPQQKINFRPKQKSHSQWKTYDTLR